MSDKRDKYRGCLIGGAAGDALGYAVEFVSEKVIFGKYGKNGITEYILHNGKALISDDTQMTMFTATALLDDITKECLKTGKDNLTDILREGYKGWFITQTAPFPVNIIGNSARYSWLMNMPQIFRNRAPGNTCMTVLGSRKKGTLQNTVNNSKGCGGVMRVAPIALYFARFNNLKQEKIDLIGAEAAAITHGHELGYIPAAALVHIISLLIKDDSLSILQAVNDSIAAMQKLFQKYEHIGYFTELMNKAVGLAQSDCSDLEAIHQLGEGWVAEETLAVAAYCAIKYQNNFEKAICTAVNHNGDSDSTGSVCGNILGAYTGYEAIPQKFKTDLEFHNVLLELANDLFTDCPLSDNGKYLEKSWTAKYFDKKYRMKV